MGERGMVSLNICRRQNFSYFNLFEDSNALDFVGKDFADICKIFGVQEVYQNFLGRVVISNDGKTCFTITGTLRNVVGQDVLYAGIMVATPDLTDREMPEVDLFSSESVGGLISFILNSISSGKIVRVCRDYLVDNVELFETVLENIMDSIEVGHDIEEFILANAIVAPEDAQDQIKIGKNLLN